MGSFSAALSGLNANATYLGVIGNNLANINTIGFKASTVNFVDLVSQSVGGASANPMQAGLGVVTGSISPVFSQGSPQTTHEATNVAIQGNGFFVVKQASGGNAFTRDGDGSFDSSGKLVTTDGLAVQGWTTTDPATGAIVTTAAPTDVTIPPGVLRAPTATTSFRTVSNLDASAATGNVFATSVEIVDGLGTSHVVTVTYTKTGAGAWDYKVEVPGEDVSGGTAGTPFSVKTGNLTFDGTGKLTGIDGGTVDVALTTPAWSDGAAASTISWDLFDTSATGVLTGTLTGYSSASTTSSKIQNGSASGMVDNVSILPDGTIQANFGAGQTVAVGKLALASFNNPKGLTKLGSNRYGEGQAAGLPNIGEAGSGGRGTLTGSALETSNVDIATEFTQMILAQRGYQANSKTITVSDEILVDTLQLKR